MKNILVTGGAGFIGSHFAEKLLREEPSVRVVDVDALTYASSRSNLELLSGFGSDRHVFVHADIRDAAAISELFGRYEIDTVAHFAAESHVDRSIADPAVFVSTNVLGTQVLLDAALRVHESGRPIRFLFVSTDEVYGPAAVGAFDESAPFRPRNPYAASKAGADHLTASYGATYGLPVMITRCTNNYGPRQHGEKLIPLAITRSLAGEAIPIYGDGLQVRDWIYVEDHCDALLAVLRRGRNGEVYNIGFAEAAGATGGDGGTAPYVAPDTGEITNLGIVGRLLDLTGSPHDRIVHVADRAGHDRRYALCSRKIRQELGWSPRTALDEGLRRTISWYRGFLLTMLLVLGFALTGCAIQAEQPVRVALAEQFGLGYAPLDIMRARGFLEQELEAAGIGDYRIEWKKLANTAAIREAMLAGEIDVGFVAIPPFLIGRDNGMDWKIIAGISRSQVALIGRAPDVDSIADLGADHRIALPQLGSVQHILLKMALADLGKPTDALDRSLSIQSHPDGALLFAGDPSVLHMTAPPYIQADLAQPGARIILDGREAFGGDFTFIVGVCPARFHELRSAYRALERALHRAVRYVEEQREDAVALLCERYEYRPEFLRALLDSGTLRFDTEIEGLERFYEFMNSEHMIDALDPSELIWERP